MSTQFIRIEGYGRKARGAAHRNARGIIAEIMRAPEASAHIEITSFEGARVIYGKSPNDLLQMARHRSAIATDRRGHALKRNSNILFVAVVSFPLSRADRAADDGWAEAYERWSELNIAWASTRWRDCDFAIVEHTDEDKRHQHIIVVPRLRADGQLDVAKAILGSARSPRLSIGRQIRSSARAGLSRRASARPTARRCAPSRMTITATSPSHAGLIDGPRPRATGSAAPQH